MTCYLAKKFELDCNCNKKDIKICRCKNEFDVRKYLELVEREQFLEKRTEKKEIERIEKLIKLF